MAETRRGILPADPIPVVVPAGGGFDGLVMLRHGARIDGAVSGEIVAADCVWLGEKSRVQARVSAREVVIAGFLEGEVSATAKVELLATARVTARLETPRMILADGSFFRGQCVTGPHGAAVEAPDTAGKAANRDAGTP